MTAERSVVITGADGFIGRAVVRLARARGFQVVACGRDWDLLRDPLPVGPGDQLIHLAALTDVAASWGCPELFLETNAAGAARVFRLAHEAGASIVYLNTCPYSGDNVSPITEDGRLFDRSPYHMSKRVGEEFGRLLGDRFGASFTSLRVFNIFGPGQPSRFVIPHILDQALDPAAAEISVQQLSPRRDYVYIDDMAAACLAAPTHRAGFACYNVGSGVAHSVEELISAIQDAAATRKIVVERGEKRRNEADEIFADYSRINSELGWAPTTRLREGLEECIRSRKSMCENEF